MQTTLDDDATYLQKNPTEVRALVDDLLICVTSFFREPEALEILSDKVFREIVKNRSPAEPVRIWAAGCATGEEAYSVAICLTGNPATRGDPERGGGPRTVVLVKLLRTRLRA